MRPWRLLFTGRRSGAWNMAADAAILHSVEAGNSPPTLRLYGWAPWCVSLGHFQSFDRELDAAALRERGWDCVRRPTGGRAVLHAEEITYSLLARRDEAPWCGTLAESYDRIGHAWAKALDGFDLNLSKGQGGLARATRESPVQPTLPCFASTSRAELAFGERKVVGSAQRRTRGAFVQHGSIPVTPDHERLVEVLPLDAARKAAYLDVLKSHAISLGEIAPLPADFSGAWMRDLGGKLLEGLGVEGAAGELTPDEAATAARLEAGHREKQKAFLGT